jgi:hypothetical protein
VDKYSIDGRVTDAIRRMHFSCLITEVTSTNSEHVILIVFPLQLQLGTCSLLLCYMYIACFVQHMKSQVLPAVTAECCLIERNTMYLVKCTIAYERF